MKIKKIISLIVATTCAASLFSFMPSFAADSPLFFSECENATLSDGLQVTTNIYNVPKPGFSGDGFVWMQNGGTLKFTVTVPKTGMYQLSTSFMQELSPEGRLQHLYINNTNKGSFMLPYRTTWSDYDFGFHRLNEGENIIEIRAGWGFAYFDTLTVDFAQMDPLDVQPILADKQATKETQSLMDYLCDVYGKNTLSGQQEIYGSGHEGDSEYEFKWLYDLTGEYPAIRGFDYMNYNPIYGWDDGTTERIVDWVNEKNGIATVCWHIHVPNDFTTYELGEILDWQKATYKPNATFDTAKATVKGTKEYDYLMLAIEDLAEQLLILQENNVPVLFRPFHEAEGNGGLLGEGAWFWWATAGADEYIKLWKLLYTELTEKYDLHNLIWTYNSYTYDTSPAWYPGDDFVDIVGFDKYNTVYNRYDGLTNCPNEDAISTIFYKLVDLTKGKKMVAMTENDTVPSLENLTVERAAWSYFCPWYAEYLMDEKYNNADTLKELYQSDYVLTLDELPDLKTYVSKKTGGSTTETTTEAPTIIYGDLDGSKKVDNADLVRLSQHLINEVVLTGNNLKAADVALDGVVDIADLALLKQYIMGDSIKLGN